MYEKDRTTIKDRREMLRVKLKSLAEEARIIRREEQRSWGMLREDLHKHRVLQVRRAAREAHLAYGLIKGLEIHQIEPIRYAESATSERILFDNVRKLIRRYGPADFAEPEYMAKVASPAPVWPFPSVVKVAA
jgi:hypothetical protein